MTPQGGSRGRWTRNALGYAVLAAVVWLLFLRSARLEVIPPDAAPAASPLVVRGTGGASIDLADYRGSVVVVNLWASWCGPCRAEIPAFSRTQAALADRGLKVLGINVEGLPVERVAELQAELGMTFAAGVPERPLAGTFQPAGGIPQTFLVDRRGRVRANHTGRLTESTLRRACLRLLEE